ncbi:MAG: hypothetical protein ACYDHM_14010 [Acidiferrobacterales bacterium]
MREWTSCAPGICRIAWAQARATDSLLEVLNGLFQAANPGAGDGYRFVMTRTAIPLTTSKPEFPKINPHVRNQST